MRANEYRIILSGIGGDEFTGGVPYCISELADLLVQRRFIRLAKQLRAWSLAQKRTWTDLASNTLKKVRPEFLRRVSWDGKEAWPWIERDFLGKQSETFVNSMRPSEPSEGGPSFRTNVSAVAAVSWQLANVTKLHQRTAKANCYDRGFPFLDRDFLEFMFAIPRDQVLRPGQYRSLMRRGLAGIVPNEILNRTRKAFAVRRPALGILSIRAEISQLFARSQAEGFGWMSSAVFLKFIRDLAINKNSPTRHIQQTVTLEMWLRSLTERGTLKGTPTVSEIRESVLEGVA